MIALDRINRQEALRYLGDGRVEMNSSMQALMDACEEELLSVAAPKYLYKEIQLGDSGLVRGRSVAEHLKGCDRAVLLCVTIGAGVDRLIRTAQVEDMARAVVLDSMASAAVEQVCARLDDIIACEYPQLYLTWRFSPGYGDYPIELQKTFLDILDAPRKIGLCTNESCLLTPSKSVTAITGLCREPIERKRRGCSGCNMAKTCKFRKAGTRCDF